MRRFPQFEALEHRLTMSGGLAHPAVALAARQHAIKGNLSGGESSIIPDTIYVAMGGFHGKLGKVQLQSTLYGQVSNNRLLGASLHLFNSQGTIIADLGPGKLVKNGKFEKLKASMIFEDATGAYALAEGSAGTATIQLKPGKTKAQAALDEHDWDADNATIDLLINSGRLNYLAKLFDQNLP